MESLRPFDGGIKGRRRAARAAAALALCAAGWAAWLPAARAESSWPAKPVRVVAPFSTGGTADILARIVAHQLTKQLGQSFVVENRPGAGATIGAAEVARSPADGYTLLVITPTFSITQFVYPSLPYDGRKDFVPVGLVMTTPLVLVVNPASGMRTAGDFIRAAKASPGKVSFSSAGVGSTPHLGFELLEQSAGIELLHVPFKGGGEAINAVLGGTTNAYFAAPIEVGEMLKAGRLTALGATSLRRTELLSDLPTLAESGVPGFEVVHYTAIMVRAGTPPDIVAKLSENLVRALRNPEVREKISQNGGEVPAGTMEEAKDLFAREYPRWSHVVKAAGIKPE
ncbi:tripartite tricarboxylate transporter substrate binding protein [Pigmentiphaga soli]|uniref:Tripartite tricarboxylate transporter substrate binding protein n=1 Tax=Pigmentiphaga soli TaxID=1007095 RepID=A0ABP8GLJ8_9BURK